jgi:hypothetical protein
MVRDDLGGARVGRGPRRVGLSVETGHEPDVDAGCGEVSDRGVGCGDAGGVGAGACGERADDEWGVLLKRDWVCGDEHGRVPGERGVVSGDGDVRGV